jgi:hypothetical protein
LTVEIVLLALRFLAGALLLAFLIALFVVLWRDYQMAASAVSETKRQRGRLVVIASTDEVASTGDSYPLLPITSLGRGPTNTIVLPDTFCSQEHALVTRRGGQWWLEDRNSSNGTRLNGERVAEPVVISSGDVIEVGQVQLKLELE